MTDEYPWNVLDIEPTCEARAIKKAYAKILKIRKPEQDPEGFQALREAKDFALILANLNFDPDTEELGSFSSNTPLDPPKVCSEPEVLEAFETFKARLQTQSYDEALNAVQRVVSNPTFWENPKKPQELNSLIVPFIIHNDAPNSLIVSLSSLLDWNNQFELFNAYIPDQFLNTLRIKCQAANLSEIKSELKPIWDHFIGLLETHPTKVAIDIFEKQLDQVGSSLFNSHRMIPLTILDFLILEPQSDETSWMLFHTFNLSEIIQEENVLAKDPIAFNDLIDKVNVYNYNYTYRYSSPSLFDTITQNIGFRWFFIFLIFFVIRNDWSCSFPTISRPSDFTKMNEMAQKNYKYVPWLSENDFDTMPVQELLIYACQRNNIPAMKRVLKEQIDLNAPLTHDRLPLFEAVYFKSYAVQRMLLEHGANPNQNSEGNWTPLHLAITMNDKTAIKFLVQNGADPYISTKECQISPLDYAKNRSMHSLIPLLDQKNLSPEKNNP